MHNIHVHVDEECSALKFFCMTLYIPEKNFSITKRTLYTCTYTCNTYMYMCIYMHSVHMYMYMCIYMYSVHMYMYIYIRTYMYMHTCLLCAMCGSRQSEDSCTYELWHIMRLFSTYSGQKSPSYPQGR